jgi:small subunit ribosomal protein S8
MFNDPISDLLTRIRNAGVARKPQVVMPHSKLKQQVAEILRDNGLVIVSTSAGVMTGRQAHKQGLGGELICRVW